MPVLKACACCFELDIGHGTQTQKGISSGDFRNVKLIWHNTLILHPHQQRQVHHSLRSQRGANTVTNMTRIPMATIAGKKKRIKRKKLSLALGEKRRSQRNIVIEKASRAALKVKVKKIALKGKVIESTLMLSLDLVPELVPVLDKNF